MAGIHLFRPVVYQTSIDAVTEVLKSGWTGLGPKTQQFERDFAAYTEAKFCVALNSCTSALHLALRLLDLEEGDEVITTAMTFVSTNHAILYEGAKPVFADVQLNTGCIDPEDVEAKITPKTRAIIAVHYGGYPCDIDRLHKIGRDHNIPIIEDCAHAAGASYRGQKIGSLSTINCFSFHSVKNLSIGDGGAITTQSAVYDERLRKLRWLGINKSTFARTETSDSNLNPRAYAWKYDVEEVGFKYHMNDISAAIGIEQLKMLDQDNSRRAEIAHRYRKELGSVPGITLMKISSDRRSSNHIMAIRAEGRDRLMDSLKQQDIHCGVHYLLNDQYRMYDRTPLPNARQLQDELISLPQHLMLTDDDVARVIKSIKKGW